jgi:hypothetical protein
VLTSSTIRQGARACSDELNDGSDLVDGAKGLWAMPAVAATPLEAEELAIAEMRAGLKFDTYEEDGKNE